jgi:RNA polymerase sigma-70 factor (ECF subfamily)
LPLPDRLAFEAFAREHRAALQAMAQRLCGNPTDAADLLQDTLEKGLKNFHRYQPGTNGRAWLITILHRLFLDRCRARAREARAEVTAEEVGDRVPAPEPEPAPAWAAVDAARLREAVGQLNDDLRAVYQLHAIERRPYSEVAERLRLNKATVGTRLLRARRRLKELLFPGQPGQGEGKT